MKNKMSRFVFLTACICILSCILVACDSGSNAATEASTEAAEAASTTEDSETADSEDVAAILIGSEDAELSEESEETDESGNSEATEEEQGLKNCKFGRAYNVIYHDGLYYYCKIEDNHLNFMRYDEVTGEEQTLISHVSSYVISDSTIYYSIGEDAISAYCFENNKYIEDITNGKLKGYSLDYMFSCNNDYIMFFANPIPSIEDFENDAGWGYTYDYSNIVVTSAYHGEDNFNPTTYFIPNNSDTNIYIYAEDVSDAYIDERDLYIYHHQGGYGDDFVKINLDDFSQEKTTRLNLVDGFDPINKRDYQSEIAYMLSNATGDTIPEYTIAEVYNNCIVCNRNDKPITIYDSEGNVVKEILRGSGDDDYSILNHIGCCNNHILYSDNGQTHCDELVP